MQKYNRGQHSKIAMSARTPESTTAPANAEANAGATTDAATVPGAASLPPPYRVLLVEDFELTLTFLSTTLRYCRSAHVVCATCAEDALALVQECGPFDVIVTDIHMVGMSGVAFIRTLRQLEADRQWPAEMVVAMSADEGCSDAAQAAGCNMFIFKYNEPVRTLLGILDKARARKQEQ